MRSRTLVVLAALAGAVLVLLPLGGGALAATSSGADGDIAFVNGGNILLKSTGTAVVTGAVDPSWSPDGKKLAFSARSPARSPDVRGHLGLVRRAQRFPRHRHRAGVVT